MSVYQEVNRILTDLQDSEHDEIQGMLEQVADDNRSITEDTAVRGLHYMDELERNWEAYKAAEDGFFHGTKTANIEPIVENGLTPGSENTSKTGERMEDDEVCLAKFGLALNYALGGTPRPEQVQYHAQEGWNHMVGRDDECPDITTEQGRRRFLTEAEDCHWGMLHPILTAVENYEALKKTSRSDPMVVGATEEMLDPVPESAEAFREKTEQELYKETKGFPEIRTDRVESSEFHIFMPHDRLDHHRSEYGDRAEILSIEAMQTKRDHENWDSYEENGVLEYNGVWNRDTEYLLTHQADIVEHNKSTLIPDAPA